MHFEAAFRYAILNEGEQSNDPADRGGLTRWGITEGRAREHRCIVHQNGIDVRKVDVDLARHIYQMDYWFFEGIKDTGVAVKLFDWGVNFGPRWVMMTVQEMLNTRGFKLKVDGVFGKMTNDAINSQEPVKFLDTFEDYADKRYAGIIIDEFIKKYGRKAFEQSQLKFLKGWLSRSNKRYYVKG
jgi:lysozyme family protein